VTGVQTCALPIWVAFGATFGVILSAVYALTLYRRVVFGEMINPKLETIADMNIRETITFAPLVIMTLVLGIYPALAIDVTQPAVEALLGQLEHISQLVEGASP